MYLFKAGTSITATLNVQIEGVQSLLTIVPLTVAGDQQVRNGRSEVVVTWKVGERDITVLVPVHRIDGYQNYFVVPDAVA